MLEALSDKLSGVFQKLGSHGSITEKDLDEAMREVRIALLEADVNFKVVRQCVAAAGEQLRSLGKQLGMPVFEPAEKQKLPDLCTASLVEAKRQGASVVIVDTAGRSTIDGEMMSEVSLMRDALNPNEIMLVLDAMTGQEAVNVAQEFHDQLNVTGIIVTKMDGDARGGAVLSIRAVSGLPVKFMGTGEKSDALEPFFPDRFASRILGMGDMLGLIERAKDAISEDEVQALEKRMKAKELDLNDFLMQFQRIKKMGPLTPLVDMIPGLGHVKRQMKVDDLDEGFWKRAEA